MGCDSERCPTVHNLQSLAHSVILGCSPSLAVTSFCTVSAGALFLSQIQSGRFSAVRSSSLSLFFNFLIVILQGLKCNAALKDLCE